MPASGTTEVRDDRALDLGALVDRVRAGDEAAWITLTDRFTALLWSIARSMRLDSADAADAVQTTWLRLVEHVDGIREGDRVGSWLAATMRHECLATLRRRSRQRPGIDDLADRADATAPAVDDGLLRTERDAALWRGFRDLPPNCQQLLRALLVDPAPTYAEVAAGLDMRIGSIGPTRRRCLDRLRAIVGGDPAGGR